MFNDARAFLDDAGHKRFLQKASRYVGFCLMEMFENDSSIEIKTAGHPKG